MFRLERKKERRDQRCCLCVHAIQTQAFPKSTQCSSHPHRLHSSNRCPHSGVHETSARSVRYFCPYAIAVDNFIPDTDWKNSPIRECSSDWLFQHSWSTSLLFPQRFHWILVHVTLLVKYSPSTSTLEPAPTFHALCWLVFFVLVRCENSYPGRFASSLKIV